MPLIAQPGFQTVKYTWVPPTQLSAIERAKINAAAAAERVALAPNVNAPTVGTAPPVTQHPITGNIQPDPAAVVADPPAAPVTTEAQPAPTTPDPQPAAEGESK